MAVKQASPDGTHAMARESKLLHLITSTGTAHIVKLYKAIFKGPGTGATRPGRQDPLPFDANGGYDENLEVARMYLEFDTCGDMSDYERKLFLKTGVLKPPEEHL